LSATQLLTQFAVVILASVFLFGKGLKFKSARRSRHWITASAGASVAYVWLHIIPELSEAQGTFTNITQEMKLPLPEFRIYLSALFGFVLFYGLEHMSWPGVDLARRDTEQSGRKDLIYRVRLGGFVAYGGLVSYLMVRDSNRGPLSLLTYFVAMSLHFIVVNHSFGEEYGDKYDRSGRWLLALAVLAGGFIGNFALLPEHTILTLLGFVAGAVIENNTMMELAKGKGGQFWAFFAGAVGYSLLLVAI
jgi:uncharacterized protein YqgC (DUF456 family)